MAAIGLRAEDGGSIHVKWPSAIYTADSTPQRDWCKEEDEELNIEILSFLAWFWSKLVVIVIIRNLTCFEESIFLNKDFKNYLEN